MKKLIKQKVKLDELLLGLAEEAAELSQAALKYRRILYGVNNPTPVTESDGYENLCEELADVSLLAETLGFPWVYIKGLQDKKEKRWAERLGIKDENNNIGG